jgi:hypothetical protein
LIAFTPSEGNTRYPKGHAQGRENDLVTILWHCTKCQDHQKHAKDFIILNCLISIVPLFDTDFCSGLSIF